MVSLSKVFWHYIPYTEIGSRWIKRHNLALKGRHLLISPNFHNVLTSFAAYIAVFTSPWFRTMIKREPLRREQKCQKIIYFVLFILNCTLYTAGHGAKFVPCFSSVLCHLVHPGLPKQWGWGAIRWPVPTLRILLADMANENEIARKSCTQLKTANTHFKSGIIFQWYKLFLVVVV